MPVVIREAGGALICDIVPARFLTAAVVVEGQRTVAEGTTSYTNGDFFWNLWTLRFDGEGQCAEFVEWFMIRPRG